nr:protein FAR1-related sequence 5-like [Tanacetum cinerariifolium]
NGEYSFGVACEKSATIYLTYAEYFIKVVYTTSPWKLTKFVLNVFDTIHNHELEREEYKHLSNTERQLTYMEQAFIVKAASVNIGVTRAHHLLTGDSDAQMLIHKMKNRKKHVSDFSFDYLVENSELTAIFWADEVSKYNYRKFSDVVSFDATFKTNKYKMVLVSFTAIENHKKCVTVAAGLLKNETTKSYICLLKAFMKAFEKAPSIVVIDQDRAMRNAIKLSLVGPSIIYACGISPKSFLLRTTSRSESENSFFSHFTNFGSTLMNFMNCFETAVEKQRHVKERMDHKTIDIVPKLKTLFKIERHASNVYTRSEVCIIKEIPYVYEMPNKKKKPQSVDKGNDKAKENDKVDLFFKKDGLYKVLRNVGDGSVVCSCQLSVRVGILCKHIFCVFKNTNVEMIPQQYILRRWTKTLIPAALRNKRNIYGKKNVVVKNYANEATSIVDHCVHLLSKDEPRLSAFVEKLKSLKKELPAIDVNNPTVGSIKGQKKLRIKGGKEKVIEKKLKGRNSCSLCGDTDHNKRTSPRRFEGQDEAVFQKEVGQEDVLVQKKVCQEEVVQEKVDLAEDEEELSKEDEDLIHE